MSKKPEVTEWESARDLVIAQSGSIEGHIEALPHAQYRALRRVALDTRYDGLEGGEMQRQLDLDTVISTIRARRRRLKRKQKKADDLWLKVVNAGILEYDGYRLPMQPGEPLRVRVVRRLSPSKAVKRRMKRRTWRKKRDVV